MTRTLLARWRLRGPLRWSLLVGGALTLPLAFTASAHDEEEHEEIAEGSTWEPETCTNHAQCGKIGPLVPMTYNAVGSGLVWVAGDWNRPRIQYKGRHSELKPTDVVDEACLEQLITEGADGPADDGTLVFSAWPIPRSEWQPLWPSGQLDTVAPINVFMDGDPVTWSPVNQGGNPSPGKSLNVCLRSSFKHLMLGGYRLRQGQSNFTANRIRAYMSKENSQLWHLGHPDAFASRGVFDNAKIDEGDALLNLASFEDAGYSRGLRYNIYSLGYATLADGRVVNVGGHAMNSNAGLRKLNIYQPETNSWIDRGTPCNLARWVQDRYGVMLGYQAYADAAAGGSGLGERLVNPPAGAPNWGAECDQHNRDHIDPPHPSDMRYQRWYPSAITMPDGRVLMYGGDDLDESVPPNELEPDKDCRDLAYRATQVMIPVTEIYDPASDRTTALENARRIFPLYPQATIVESREDPNAWKVCVLGGLPAPATEASLPRGPHIDPAAEWRRHCVTPGCSADTRAIRQARAPFPAASLDCLDVRAAEQDPLRNVPDERHWKHVATARDSHDYCCGAASLLELDSRGKTVSSRWVVVGGKAPRGAANAGTRTATVEMIDFMSDQPTWVQQQDLYQAAFGAYATALPDGTVLISGGAGPGGDTFEKRHNTKHQLFNPADGSVRTLAKSTFITSNFHMSVLLLPDATVLVMGGDRDAMVQAGDRAFSKGDDDLGVSVAQRFSPPYLFKADGTQAPRPVITKAPQKIDYGQLFEVQVGPGHTVGSVALVRTGFVTHTLNTDLRYVKLPFTAAKQPAATRGTLLRVRAPSTPAQSVPGDHMLFVLDDQGVPSVAARVRLTR